MRFLLTMLRQTRPLCFQCALTHAKQEKLGDFVDLRDSFMSAFDQTGSLSECEESALICVETPA